MNAKNLICWAVLAGVYIGLVICGSLPAVRFESGPPSLWGRAWKRVQEAPLSTGATVESDSSRPPPSPPPQPVSRDSAAALIRVATCYEYVDTLVPRLRPSIRVSPVVLESERDLDMGDSRMCAALDVPPGFQWPRHRDQPLTPLAQIRLSDLSSLEGSGVLPASGWLYFFYDTKARPRITGERKTDKDAWKVIYSDAAPETLVRTKQPSGVDSAFPACRLRFWNEWTLPSLSEEPKLLEGDGRAESGYADLCVGLTGRPDELGWHHMLGHAQVNSGPMFETLERLVPANSTEKLPKAGDLSAGSAPPADEWVLLLQVDLEALADLTVPPDELGFRRRFMILGEMLYFWIRADDLRARDFSRVWTIRRGYDVDPDEYDNYDEQEKQPELDAPTFGGELG